MGATKFYVLRLRGMIKFAVMILIGLALIFLFAHFFAPRDEKVGEPETSYVPGTYSSKIILHNNPVIVEVSVDESRILSIELKDMGEVQEVFYPLMRPTLENMAQEIIEKQSLDVATDRDSAQTREVLLNAVVDALEQAKAV